MPFGTRLHPHSLPATPTAANVRTFTDFSAEHTRLTTLHGSAGALEVNNLGGFKLGPLAMNGGAINGTAVNGGGGVMNGGLNGMSGVSNPITSSSSAGKFPSVFFDSTIDGVVKRTNGTTNGTQHTLPPPPPPPFVPAHNPYDIDDEISDVFSGLSMDPVIAAPGYGRGRSRRCSAPVNSTNPWGSEIPEHLSENPGYFIAPPPPPKAYSSNALSSAASTGWNGAPVTAGTQPSTVSSIWTTPFQGSRPESQASSYSNSNSDQGSSLSGYSPIYSPVATTNGFFEVGSNPMTTVSEDQRPSFKVRHIPVYVR